MHNYDRFNGRCNVLEGCSRFFLKQTFDTQYIWGFYDIFSRWSLSWFNTVAWQSERLKCLEYNEQKVSGNCVPNGPRIVSNLTEALYFKVKVEVMSRFTFFSQRYASVGVPWARTWRLSDFAWRRTTARVGGRRYTDCHRTNRGLTWSEQCSSSLFVFGSSNWICGSINLNAEHNWNTTTTLSQQTKRVF